MTLALLVYVVNLLTSIDNFLGGLVGAMIVFAIAAGTLSFFAHDPRDEEGWKEWRAFVYKYIIWPKTLVLSLLITWLIPDQKTIEYMGAAYIIQETYESEFVQKAGTLAGQAVLNQLTVWAKDNGEVEKLLEQLKAQGVVVPTVPSPSKEEQSK